MFSGLVGYRGEVIALRARPAGGATLTVRCEGAQAEGVAAGDSIAVDGVCLTATAVDGNAVGFEVIPETLACSTLAERAAGDRVNVEYALRLGDRLGGHFVYGHVDAAAAVLSRTHEGQGERLRLATPPSLERLILKKGFIAVDGVSLTVAQVGDGWFEVALIPETLARTTLGTRARVNLEVDPIARVALRQARGDTT